MRLVQGLRWARALEGWPSFMPKPRARRASAKAAGLAYERALRLEIPSALPVWFEFEDRLGRAWCQVDGLILGRQSALVLEAKLTWLLEAHLKMEGLYLPVVSRALQLPTFGIVVAKRLLPECRQISHSSLDSALRDARLGRRAVWHWQGSAVSLARAA